jgi:glycosyltransferase involved in cell wall biosynthesis
MERHRIAVVIPALNEAATIGAVVRQALARGAPIVVDDGSSDATAQIARDAGADVVVLPSNRGYDGALNAGFARASEMECAYIVTMDADGQHNPDLLLEFIAALDAGADVVVGVRDRTQRFAESVFAWYGNLRWGIRDPLCGMKAYRAEVYRALGHFDAYQSIGTELALFAARSGYRLAQLPVKTRDRVGAPRFGRVLSANMRILRALARGMFAPAPTR